MNSQWFSYAYLCTTRQGNFSEIYVHFAYSKQAMVTCKYILYFRLAQLNSSQQWMVGLLHISFTKEFLIFLFREEAQTKKRLEPSPTWINKAKIDDHPEINPCCSQNRWNVWPSRTEQRMMGVNWEHLARAKVTKRCCCCCCCKPATVRLWFRLQSIRQSANDQAPSGRETYT